MSEVLKAIESVGGAFNELKATNESRFAAMQDKIEKLESLSDRPRATTGNLASRAETKVFNQWARTGAGLPTEGKAMSMSAAADGQALVPEVIASEIIDAALSQGGIANIVRRTPVTTSDYVRLVNLRGQAAAWSAEAGSRSESASMQFLEVRPTHGELYSVVSVTNWLLQDSQFDVARLITENASAQFGRSLETAIVSGSGSNQPTGILTNAPVASPDDASPLRDTATIEKVEGGAHLGDDIVSLYFALRPAYRKRASFVMSSSTLAAVRKLRDANGSGYLFQPRLDGAVDAADGTILGKNVYTCEDLADYGDGSPQKLCILCGDFVQGYELTEIGGMTIVRDPYSTHGKTLFYIAARFGGRLTDAASIKVLSG